MGGLLYLIEVVQLGGLWELRDVRHCYWEKCKCTGTLNSPSLYLFKFRQSFYISICLDSLIVCTNRIGTKRWGTLYSFKFSSHDNFSRMSELEEQNAKAQLCRRP